MKKKLKEDVAQIWQGPTHLQIGRKGISQDFFDELEMQLERKKFVKVKVLQNAPFKNRSEAFSLLQQRLSEDLKLLEVRGRTAIITKKK